MTKSFGSALTSTTGDPLRDFLARASLIWPLKSLPKDDISSSAIAESFLLEILEFILHPRSTVWRLRNIIQHTANYNIFSHVPSPTSLSFPFQSMSKLWKFWVSYFRLTLGSKSGESEFPNASKTCPVKNGKQTTQNHNFFCLKLLIGAIFE